MNQTIGMVEAKSKLAEIVAEVKYGGKRFILERRGRPMAVLISIEEYEGLQAQADAASPVSPLPPALQRRQAMLVERARELEQRLGDPIAGLAELFSSLPPADDNFWVEIQETG